MKALKSLAKKMLGERRARALHQIACRIAYRGTARYCPCCDSQCRKFLSFGIETRHDVRCPFCGSLERHRLISLYLEQRTDLFDGRRKKLLHVAPEAPLSSAIERADYIDYLSADLDRPDVMARMDITDIDYPADTFDVILCSHVLEHVPEDRKAMAEFFRVPKPGGWAILQVPILAETTFEDFSVTDPAERERLFGQHDHVRSYGPDYADRLAEAGFSGTVDAFVRDLGEAEIRRQGLTRHENVYFCVKDAASA
ncbi:MAG: methyltransferase domain-containing protein [Deltaproteobacteria bacterium]|nr:methyltransferase domain-containing protein [Deltaproteobacteria bacterium]MBW2540481.1 methyltransferase domain-containing protein [Deltaproteobacteria bacterium]